MANLKNIADLPVAESAEGLNLIVNDNGAAKQIAASAVGTSSWNDLKDKPFYSETDEDGNETVHKLDAKYLPEYDVIVDVNTQTVTKGSYDGLRSIILNGEMPKGKIFGTNEEGAFVGTLREANCIAEQVNVVFNFDSIIVHVTITPDETLFYFIE